MATTALTLDGFPLIGATPAGGRARLETFDGWLETQLRRSRDDRTGRHGSYSSTGLREPVPYAVKGEIFYSDPVACAQERRALLGLDTSSADVNLVVTDSLGTLPAGVSIEAAATPPVNHLITAFSFTLVNETALVTSTTPHTPVALAASSTGVALNDGSAPADLLVTVTAAGTVVLTAGGITLVTAALPVGAVIDTATESVRSAAGVDLLTLVTTPRFPAVPAGGGPVAQAGTAALSVVTSDTYV